MELSRSKTEENLKKTFALDSRTVTQYQLFAEQARREGNEFIARIFEESANHQLGLSRQVYGRFLGQIKSLQENLEYSMLTEASALTKFLEYEQTATEEGFDEIAVFYREARVVLDFHRRQFEDLFGHVSNGTLYNRPTIEIWQCLNCGYLHEGKEAPFVCPVDNYPQGWYKLVCANY
ncbi:rubredoxin-like domain-containing protein [Clostridium sp.]|uniref:rubrerythrin family protein n=1 Tax=Clostridium sp. TaxID=1506 RepID=UPI002FCAEED1